MQRSPMDLGPLPPPNPNPNINVEPAEAHSFPPLEALDDALPVQSKRTPCVR